MVQEQVHWQQRLVFEEAARAFAKKIATMPILQMRRVFARVKCHYITYAAVLHTSCFTTHYVRSNSRAVYDWTGIGGGIRALKFTVCAFPSSEKKKACQSGWCQHCQCSFFSSKSEVWASYCLFPFSILLLTYSRNASLPLLRCIPRLERRKSDI